MVAVVAEKSLVKLNGGRSCRKVVGDTGKADLQAMVVGLAEKWLVKWFCW